jgi:hypothetical protein
MSPPNRKRLHVCRLYELTEVPRFVCSLVQRVRAGNLQIPETAPLRMVAEHRETGKRLGANIPRLRS